jgi:hypothetical protein
MAEIGYIALIVALVTSIYAVVASILGRKFKTPIIPRSALYSVFAA